MFIKTKEIKFYDDIYNFVEENNLEEKVKELLKDKFTDWRLTTKEIFIGETLIDEDYLFEYLLNKMEGLYTHNYDPTIECEIIIELEEKK